MAILLKSLIEWKEHGSVWKSKSGKFGAKNKRGKVKYFKEEEQAHRHADSGGTPSSQVSLIRKTLGGGMYEATAGEDAARRGLIHTGHGNYADRTGKVVAKSVDGKLVDINPNQITSTPPQQSTDALWKQAQLKLELDRADILGQQDAEDAVLNRSGFDNRKLQQFKSPEARQQYRDSFEAAYHAELDRMEY
jgi:hypothetical protein